MKELKASGLYSIPIGVGDTYKKYGGRIELWSMDGFEVITVGFQFKIIGSVTAEHIDFDPSDYIETTFGKTWAKDYTTGKFIDNVAQAFRSLLTANDVHFVNPYGEEPAHPIQDSIMEEGLHDRYKERLKEWQQAESKLVEKILIIKPL